MKYYYCFILLFASTLLAFGQKNVPEELKSIIEINLHKNFTSPFYLFKSDPLSKQLVDKRDYQIIRKLDDSYYIIKLNGDDLQRKTAIDDLKLWPLNNSWKESISLKGISPKAKGQYIIKSLCENLTSALKPLKINNLLTNTYLVEGSISNIRKQFLNDPCIVYIGKESLSPRSEANVSDLNLTHNRISTIHDKYPEVDGQGITISLKEKQFDLEDIDLLGKNVPSGINSDEVDNHATEMATIIAGSGNSFITGRGVAKGVKLSSSDFFDIIPDTDEEYERLSINGQNHSYGTVIENFYGTLAEAYDISTFNNPDILHIFSAGNIGTASSTEGPYQNIPGFANLTGNFKASKNTLAIGSVDAEGKVITFSSRGPAFDGRIKPELVTFGQSGTSNSAAMVSGLGALLNQKYREIFAGIPSAALLKSILINSATDVEAEGIDFKTGYGNINGERALINLTKGLFETGSVSQSDSVVFQLEIPENAINLKVTLVWTDSASSAGSTDVLINDLDLKIIHNTDQWLPWVLNPGRTNLNDLPSRSEDHLNIIEQVTIDELSGGTYDIVVKGFEVISPSQDFAIAYQYDIANEFSWSYPVKNSNLPYDGETNPHLQWNSTFSDSQSGKIEYTLDGGATWILVAENVNLSNGFYEWSGFPQEFSLSQMRMSVEGDEFLSEEFIISIPPRIRVGFDCGDSILFLWNKMANATNYNIYNLEGDQLELYKNTTDTAVLISKNSFSNTFIAIEPIYVNGTKAIRSFAINYQLQGASCYFTSIFPEVIPGEGKVLVTAFIGTTFNIDRIIIERFNNKVFEPIGEVAPSKLELEFEDLDPLQGVNIYRAVAILKNGQKVYSDATDIHFLTTRAVQVFPNPIERGDLFAVFTRNLNGAEVIIEMYNMESKLVLKDIIRSDRESFPTITLSEGLYFYRISGGGINETGKIIVE